MGIYVVRPARQRVSGDQRTNLPAGGVVPAAMPVPIFLLRTLTGAFRGAPPAVPAAGFIGTAPTTYLRVPNVKFGETADVTVGTTTGDEIGDATTGDAVAPAAGADPLGTGTAVGATF